MGETGQPADDQTCAVCGAPITTVTRTTARPSLDAADPRASIVCVRLEPCGHTFMVESGGLIH